MRFDNAGLAQLFESFTLPSTMSPTGHGRADSPEDRCRSLSAEALNLAAGGRGDLPLAPLMETKTEALRASGRPTDAEEVRRRHEDVIGQLRYNLYAQGIFKKALLARMSVEEAAVAFAAAFKDTKAPKLSVFPIESARDHLRRCGLFYAEIPTPKTFTIDRPPIFGTDEGSGTEAMGRTIFVGAVGNAIVRHRSSFIRLQDRLLLDVQDDELAAIKLFVHVDPAALDRNEDSVVVMDRCAEPNLAIEEAVHLGGVPSHAFGHWLGQFLPKLCGARRAGLLPSVPIIVDSGMRSTHREALAYFVGDDTCILELPELRQVAVERLWILSDWSYVPLCPGPSQDLGPRRLSPPPAQFAETIRWMKARTESAVGTPTKLFLARRQTRHRKMINQGRIIEVARELGFTIVYLEDHSFAEQMSLIGSASDVTGPDGSSLLMSLFAREGTRVTIQSHPFVENTASMTTILALLNIDAVILQGRCVREDRDYRRFSDYEMDETAFRLAVCR